MSQKLSKTATILILLSFAILCTFLSLPANADSKYYQLGKSVKEIKENDKVIATINKKPITNGTFMSRKIFLREAYLQLDKPAPTDDEVLLDIVKENCLYEEAQRRGLEVSDEDVKSCMDYNRNKIKEIKDMEILAPHTDFNDGLGITDDEFWNNKETFQGYKTLLTIGQLRIEIMKDLEIPFEQMNSSENAQKVENALNNLAENLAQKAVIEKEK